MVDALPYLIDYPYGCTEQTLNRFLPAVITQQTLRKMGIDLAAIQDRNAPTSTPRKFLRRGDDRERSKGWKRFDRNPVFDDAELTKVVKAGVNRLTEMQLSDGGWGWFSGWGERSAPHTTAVVMHGLLVAKSNDVAIVPSVLERGTAWLESYQAEQIAVDRKLRQAGRRRQPVRPYKRHADNLDALVYMVLAEAGKDNKADARVPLPRSHEAGRLQPGHLRTGPAHARRRRKATHGHAQPQPVRPQDDENQTAWLELPTSGWWYWYGSEYEAHAYYLKLLAATRTRQRPSRRGW